MEDCYFHITLYRKNRNEIIPVTKKSGINIAKVNPKRLIRFTLAGVLDEDKETMRYGLTFCHTKEQYLKGEGRAIATNRAIKKPVSVIKLDSPKSRKEAITYGYQLVKVIAENVHQYKELYAKRKPRPEHVSL